MDSGIRNLLSNRGSIVDPYHAKVMRTGEGPLLELPFYRAHDRIESWPRDTYAFLFQSSPGKSLKQTLEEIQKNEGEIVMECGTFVQLCSMHSDYPYTISIPPSFSYLPSIAYISLRNVQDREALLATTAPCKGQWVLDYNKDKVDGRLLLGLGRQGPLLVSLDGWIAYLKTELVGFAARHSVESTDQDDRQSASVIQKLAEHQRLDSWLLEHRPS